MVEGTIVAEFASEASGPTVGSLLGFTERVLELPPGDIGLTVNQGREKTFEVAAGSPLVAQIPRLGPAALWGSQKELPRDACVLQDVPVVDRDLAGVSSTLHPAS